jgi:hypothetical protein
MIASCAPKHQRDGDRSGGAVAARKDELFNQNAATVWRKLYELRVLM